MVADKNDSGLVRRFLGCETGATAIEYALIASGIAVAIAAVVLTVGDSVDQSFQSVLDQMNE